MNKKANKTATTLVVENTKGIPDFWKWGRILLLWAGIAALLSVFKNDLIARMYELDVFIPDLDYNTGYWNRPGGLILLISNLLTECCYFPALGIAAILAVLAGLQWSVQQVLRVNPPVLSFIPSVLAVLFVARLDYTIYLLETPGILYLLPVGVCFSLWLLYGFQRLKSLRLKIGYLLLTLIVGFGFLGFFALFAVVLMGLWTWKTMDRHRILHTLIGVAGILAVPFGYYLWTERICGAYIYFSGLPFMDFVHNKLLWIPLILTLLAVVFLVFGQMRLKKRNRWENVLAVLLVGILFGGSYRDENFHGQLKMERAIDNGEWSCVLDIARQHENPTRPLVVYRNIALLHQGCIADSMFTYPEGSEPFCTSEQITATQICASRLFLHFGQTNFSARWAMEMGTMHGMNLQWTKALAKAALYNGETFLAYKYLRALNRIPWMDAWCNKYGAYVHNPDLLGAEPEFKTVKKLSQFRQTEFISSDVAETELLDHFAIMNGGTSSMLEMSILSIMITKQVTPFWEKFDYYVQSKKGRVAKHFLEAAVLFAFLDDNLTQTTQNNVKNLVKTNAPHLSSSFEICKKMMLQYEKNNDETLKAQIKERFGKTYWYFFFLSGNLKTN